MSKKAKRHGWNAASLLLVFVLLIGAAGVLLYPEYVFWRSQKAMDKETAFIDALSGNDAATDPRVASSSREIDPALKDAYNKALPLLKAYNIEVREGYGPTINDPFGFDESNSMLTDLGIKDGLIGYINVPAMNCHMPLYLGASEANMQKGATVISGTSVPLGQKDSNCVIAGHRGYNEAVMFRDIENVKLGDTVEIVTAWEAMVYKVVDIKVISPTDANALRVVKGRDLVTLFTCHPYGYNYQRYLVFAERVGSSDTDFKADDYQLAETSESQNGMEIEGDATIVFDKLKVEKVLKPVAFCVLGLLFIWWLVALVKTVRQKKELG